MVFQSYALYPHLSVFENIAFPLRVAKVNEKELEEKVFKAADILQLRDRLDLNLVSFQEVSAKGLQLVVRLLEIQKYFSLMSHYQI